MRRTPHRMSRRRLLALVGAGAVALGARRALHSSPRVDSPSDSPIYREFSGSDLSGWRLALGDGIYTAPGETPVTIEDIETRHDGTLSEVRANIRKRRIMAHNITYRRERDELALDYTHIFTCSFRLPYMPSVDNADENGQTMDAAVFVWDGLDTLLDWGMAFQWGVNPRERFGEVRVSAEGVYASAVDAWEPVGYFTPDTEWHAFEIMVDYPSQLATLRIDHQHFPANFVGIYKRWPAAISAGIQVEAISIYPGTTLDGALHRVEFRDWNWQWVDFAVQQVYLPAILNNAGGAEEQRCYLPFVSAGDRQKDEPSA